MTFPGPDPKFLDDLARVAGGAVNIFSGLQEQIRNDVRTRFEEMATRLDLVPRDDLDQAKGMIDKLRKRIDDLEARLNTLEGKKQAPKSASRTSGKAKAKPRARPKKSTTQKSGKKK